LLPRRTRGRPTLSDDELVWRRDELAHLLSVSWCEIGWLLRGARTAEGIRSALSLVSWGKDYLVSLFLRNAPTKVSGNELRARRRTHRKAATHTQDIQKKHEQVSQLYSQIKQAVAQADGDELSVLQADLVTYEDKLTQVTTELDRAKSEEQQLRSSLQDAEAGFAQHELARIIREKRCSLNPLRLANAMAGLPIIGARISYVRCSKLKCSGWPQFQFTVFKFIESAWNRRERYPSMSLVELFDQEIRRLPRKVRRAEYPSNIAVPADQKRIDNFLRSYLGENRRYLRLAIEKTLQAGIVDPDRIPFLIVSNFTSILGVPRSALTLALAERERIDK
jgi:hypothetical protein